MFDLKFIIQLLFLDGICCKLVDDVNLSIKPI